MKLAFNTDFELMKVGLIRVEINMIMGGFRISVRGEGEIF